MRMSHDDREELESLLIEAMPQGKPTHDTALTAVRLIAMADMAGREWPDLVRVEALRAWCFKAQKEIAKRESVVLVSHNGRQIGKATRVGRRRRTQDGTAGFDQALFSEMTWDEVINWGEFINNQIDGLMPNRSLVAKLLLLRREVPNSLGPGDAARQIGTTVEAWIEAAS